MDSSSAPATAAPNFSQSPRSHAVEELVRQEVPDWDDEVLSRARFKAFSGQRPDWEPRYVFWRDLIVKIARGLGVCTVRSSEVKNVWFSRGGLVPLCIDSVLLEMYKDGDILLQRDLLDPTTGWFYQIIHRVKDMIGLLKSSMLQEKSEDNLFFRPLLEDRAASVIKHLSECHWSSSCVVTMRTFQNICQMSSEASTILSYMWQCGKAQYFLVRKSDIIEGVKISLVPASVPKITSLDCDVLQLVWTTERLQQQLDVIDRHWLRSKKSAIAYLKSGDKQAAVRQLRQAKLFCESRTKCSSLLERVEQVISIISEAESTKKVSEAIRIGSETIKANKLSLEEVILDLQELDECVSSQKEISETLGFMPLQCQEIEDEDVEGDFEKLEAEIGNVDALAHEPKASVDEALTEESKSQEPAITQSLSKLNLEAA